MVLSACSSDNGSGGEPGTDDDGGGGSITFDRKVMLENWADNIIIPSYNGFLTVFTDLKDEFNVFRADPSETNLVEFKAVWLQAYKSWQHVSMFEIGPAEENGLRLNINTFPVDVDLIEDHVTSGSYDLTLPSNRDTKGFPALDYLINGLGASDAEIAAVYSTDAVGEAYLDYMEDVINDIETRVTTVDDAWNSEYRDTFVNEDGSSASASTDRFVNDFIFYYEKFLRAGKMGIPLGVFSDIQAPNTIEAFYGGEVSNELFQDALDAVQDFFNGKHFGSSTTGESLATYLEALNEQDLRDDINNQFNSARTAVNGLQPFRTELETNNPAIDMLSAYDEVQKAVRLLKVDMLSAMSISVDFVDADGD